MRNLKIIQKIIPVLLRILHSCKDPEVSLFFQHHQKLPIISVLITMA